MLLTKVAKKCGIVWGKRKISKVYNNMFAYSTQLSVTVVVLNHPQPLHAKTPRKVEITAQDSFYLRKEIFVDILWPKKKVLYRFLRFLLGSTSFVKI
jgi:hypothetical protein